MANPTPVIITDLNGNAFAVSGTTSGTQKGAPTPVVLTDKDGNALVFGAAAIPNGSTATTQTPFSNDTKLATDAYADAIMKNQGLVWFREDFLASTSTAFTTASLFQAGQTTWVALQIVASCTPSNQIGSYTNQGILRLTTGAVSGNGGVLYMGNGAADLGALGSNSGWEYNFICRLNQVTINTMAFRFGFTTNGQEAADGPTDGIWVRYDTATDTGTGLYVFETRATSTSTTSTTNSIAPGAATFAHFRVRSTVAGTILFSVNGGTETSISTNVPTGILKPFFQCLTRTTAAAILDVDFISYVAANARP